MSAQQVIEPEDSLQDLSIQMQMFAHAPTRQAWDIIWELYQRAETRLHPEFDRHHEKIKMFLRAVLNTHPEWVEADRSETAQLAKEAPVVQTWLLSNSGDAPRKLDHLWHSYFATRDPKFSDKIVAIANTIKYNKGLRETAVWSYHLIASTAYPELAERAPAIMKMGEFIQAERLKKA